jgi:hypothetical protein
MQSVPITTKVVSSNPIHGEVHLIQHYAIIKVCQWLAVGRWFSPGTAVSSTDKTDRHDIAEILLKVEFNPTTLFSLLNLRIDTFYFVWINIRKYAWLSLNHKTDKTFIPPF